MTEEEFQRLLIKMIEIGQHPDKSKILDLLRRSSLCCDKTNEFTYRKWDHYKEYVYIIVEPHDFLQLGKYRDYLSEIIKEIYPVNDEYELFGVEIKPGSVVMGNFASQEVHFENIQRQIIDQIRAARYTIWVAMAWFTNQILYNELLKKKNEGVNVQVVVDDNEQNRQAHFRLEDEFETYRVTIQSNYKNVMHDKFCIIDLETVIHGTFNWTTAASYNRETISIDKNSATAKVFADEFIRLKTRVYG